MFIKGHLIEARPKVFRDFHNSFSLPMFSVNFVFKKFHFILFNYFLGIIFCCIIKNYSQSEDWFFFFNFLRNFSLIFIAFAVSLLNQSCVQFLIPISFIGATLSIVSEIVFRRSTFTSKKILQFKIWAVLMH